MRYSEHIQNLEREYSLTSDMNYCIVTSRLPFASRVIHVSSIVAEAENITVGVAELIRVSWLFGRYETVFWPAISLDSQMPLSQWLVKHGEFSLIDIVKGMQTGVPTTLDGSSIVVNTGQKKYSYSWIPGNCFLTRMPDHTAWKASFIEQLVATYHPNGIRV